VHRPLADLAGGVATIDVADRARLGRHATRVAGAPLV
jgi:hypothetical protein